MSLKTWLQSLKDAIIQDDPYPNDLSQLDRWDGLKPHDTGDDAGR